MLLLLLTHLSVSVYRAHKAEASLEMSVVLIDCLLSSYIKITIDIH
jgi:hypothetical protein